MARVLADYTGFDYNKNFWAGQQREYEHFADRLAVRRLIPKSGERIADICGGFGRLLPLYFGKYAEVHLFDYAQNLLDEAKAAHGDKVVTTQGSVYSLPYQSGRFDACVMVRASHHLEDLPLAISEIARVLKPHGTFVIEIANKRNVLEIIRYLLGKSTMRPFDLAPTSRNDKGFYNFHPAYVEALFAKQNLKIKKVLFVSFFRLPILKKVLGWRVLSALEWLVQYPLGFLKLSPSIYYQLEKR
jgi:ubiquinone/menaquinone biosynthesis C-methylase UbiE